MFNLKSLFFKNHIKYIKKYTFNYIILYKFMENKTNNNKDNKEIKALSAKEMKALARPEFEKNPHLYYPTKTFESLGFTRNQCPKCNHFYWRKTEKRDNCGDANCAEKYHFIGKGNGIGRDGSKITFTDAWNSYKDAMTSARVPCNVIDRYPVVARWRADVEFCAAGIYCFQPYCMTGELDPPANPLIAPQFCVRFNDLDNIGVTGRHYSGFVMLGLQVFNKKDNFIFWKDEVIEFNYRWLTEFLKIDPEEITFIEDVWCGGGNLGPCVEYFIGGLEVGNMVFIEYKVYHDGSREKLDVQVVDVGIGLERIPWLINGSPTSYTDVFKSGLSYLSSRLGIDTNHKIWDKFGPYSSMLNTDETDDIEKTWRQVSELVGEDVEVVKSTIGPIRDLYVILDHTRTLFVILYDGLLPSNVGGGGNVRNILRRVLALLHKNDWWKVIGLKGLLDLCECHKNDLEELYGKGHFKKYDSLEKIFNVEIQKWENTDKKQKEDLKKLLDKKKGLLTIDDWIVVMQSWGMPADKISEFSGQAIPGNLYYEIATRLEKTVVPTEVILYSTTLLNPTENLYYIDNKLFEFEAKIEAVYQNMSKDSKGRRNILILNRSAFYPTSGGQQHDTGEIYINDTKYEVVNCEKVGNCTLHFLDKDIPEDIDIKSSIVKGNVNEKRRKQLMSHHTGTHIIFAAARRVLGPHIWQNGAKKTTEKAHIDITHYQSLTYKEEMEIENEANRIIMESVNISKYFMNKKEAELNFGFSLYQGGVVPGNNLRIVQIQDTDVEACCGTHCDNTAEVGWLKLLRTFRVSDGVLRLEYVCYERALEELNQETEIINDLCKDWGIEKSAIVKTGNRFFDDFKKYSNKVQKQEEHILNYQFKLLSSRQEKLFYHISDQETVGYFMSKINEVHGKMLKDQGKGIVFVNKEYIYGMIGDEKVFSEEEFMKVLNEGKKENDKKKEKEGKESKGDKVKISRSIGKKKDVIEGIFNFSAICELNVPKIVSFIKEKGGYEV